MLWAFGKWLRTRAARIRSINYEFKEFERNWSRQKWPSSSTFYMLCLSPRDSLPRDQDIYNLFEINESHHRAQKHRHCVRVYVHIMCVIVEFIKLNSLCVQKWMKRKSRPLARVAQSTEIGSNRDIYCVKRVIIMLVRLLVCICMAFDRVGKGSSVAAEIYRAEHRIDTSTAMHIKKNSACRTLQFIPASHLGMSNTMLWNLYPEFSSGRIQTSNRETYVNCVKSSQRQLIYCNCISLCFMDNQWR